jgi:hypothetical protein
MEGLRGSDPFRVRPHESSVAVGPHRVSNLADSAEAAANGRATPFLPGILPSSADEELLDDIVGEPEVQARD